MRIARLDEDPGVVVLLARWFRAEWPEHYGERTARDIEADFREAKLPVLVAYEGGIAVGTAALRPQALDGFAHLAPGLGGLYVADIHRGKGIGSALVQEAMRLARGLGHREMYAATMHAGALFERLGWQAAQSVRQGPREIAVYRCRP